MPAAAAEPAAVPPSQRRGRPSEPKPEAVIPLVHAPDDPGPDAVEEIEPPGEPENGGWRKIFEYAVQTGARKLARNLRPVAEVHYSA